MSATDRRGTLPSPRATQEESENDCAQPNMEEIYRQSWMFSPSAQVLCRRDDGQVVDFNLAAAQLFDLERSNGRKFHLRELIPAHVADFIDTSFPDDSLQSQKNHIAVSAEVGRAARMLDCRVVSPAAGILRLTFTPTVFDVHRQARSEWALGAHARAIRTLINGGSIADIATRICEAITENRGYILAAVGIAADDQAARLAIIGSSGPAIGHLDGIEISGSPDKVSGLGPTAVALREGRVVTVSDTSVDPFYNPWRARGLAFCARSTLTIPFTMHDGRSGCLLVYSDQVAAFGPDEIAIFSQLTGELALAAQISQQRERLALAIDQAQTNAMAYQTAIATSSQGFWMCHADAVIREVNPALERILGFSREEIIGKHISEVVPGATYDNVMSNMAQIRLYGSATFTGGLLHKDGRVIPTQTRSSWDGNDAYFAFITDMSDFENTQRLLKSAAKTDAELRREKQEAYNALLSLSELTLREIGQDLHDDVGQVITGAAMLANSLSEKLHEESPAHAEKAANLARMLNEAIGRLRDLAKGLYPSDIDAMDLGAIIEGLRTRIAEIGRLPVEVQIIGELPVLTRDALLNLFRILQEATNNVLKHARATKIQLIIDVSNRTLCLCIVDDGIGTPAIRPRNRYISGLGQKTMKARAEKMGGTFRIAPESGGGTRVQVRIPLGEKVLAR